MQVRRLNNVLLIQRVGDVCKGFEVGLEWFSQRLERY